MTERLEVGKEIMTLVVDLLSACRERGEFIVTAESCTGGLLAATLTAIPGSSDCFERGFVTYSNASKSEMLGVPVVATSALRRDDAPSKRPGRCPQLRGGDLPPRMSPPPGASPARRR